MTNPDVNEIIDYYKDNHNFDNSKARDIAETYMEFVINDGLEHCEETKQFAIYADKKYNMENARSKDYYKNNKKAKRQSMGIANEKIENYTKNELCIDSPEFVHNAKEKFESVKDTPEDTCFKHVKTEIKHKLEEELRKPPVEREITDAIREHSNYDYNDIEVKTFSNSIITHVSKKQSEFIANKLSFEMNSNDLKGEEKTIRNKMINIFQKDTFWEGMGREIGSEIYKYISKKGIKLLAIIISMIITGGSIGIL